VNLVRLESASLDFEIGHRQTDPAPLGELVERVEVTIHRCSPIAAAHSANRWRRWKVVVRGSVRDCRRAAASVLRRKILNSPPRSPRRWTLTTAIFIYEARKEQRNGDPERRTRQSARFKAWLRTSGLLSC